MPGGKMKIQPISIKTTKKKKKKKKKKIVITKHLKINQI